VPSHAKRRALSTTMQSSSGTGMPTMSHMPNMYPIQYHHPFTTAPVASLRPESCRLIIRQNPKEALVTSEGKEKARKPIDPPPIVELQVPAHLDPRQQYLQSPYLFISVSLINGDTLEPHEGGGAQSLTGSLVSSLHRLKDTNNKDGGFFIFGDISVKVTGEFRLRFSLFEFQDQGCMVQHLSTINSAKFHVVTTKDFKGMEESTYLSRQFSDQGVRLRLRKEPRGMMGNKRGSYSANTYESSDAPSRPNRATKRSSSFDEDPSPTKRYKNEDDDRKDSFPENATVSVPSYAPPYPAAPTYQTPAYATHRLSSPVTYNSMGLQPSYTGMTAGIPSAYTSRSNVLNSPDVFTNPAFHTTTNSVLPGSFSHPGGYGGIYSTYNQRTTPATVDSFPAYPIDYTADSRFPPN
jgi:hypothetical protein